MKAILVTLSLVLSLSTFGQLATPDICLVTVDPTYTYQQIVWEKDTVSTNISHYNIYMDNGSGTPFFLGQRDFDSSSVYSDYINDPDVDSVAYYLTAVDLGGAESGYSAPHSTMHLSVVDNGAGGITCSWSHYWGRAIVAYECHRDTLTNDTWEMIFSGGSATTTWDDWNMPGTSAMQYKLMTTWTGVCSTQKAIGDFNSARSNRTSSISTPVNIEETAFVINELYPNPVEDILNLKGSQQYGRIQEVIIYNNQGKLIKKVEVEVANGEFHLEIDLSHLAADTYLVVINSTNGAFHQQFIKK
ncbi:MAG: T9SS type A sorting domain-containing protein [Flavobacteriales bacterium]|nr:T9SS type A sorting domain-containing protein [Flavobacteriales bacterium]